MLFRQSNKSLMNRKLISHQHSRRKFIHDLSVNADMAALAFNGLNLFSSCDDPGNKNKESHMQKGDQKKLGIALVGL